MNESEILNRENQALRARLSKLSEASLRITEDLDLDTVLQEVLDGARALTSAGRGGMSTLDDTGSLQDFVTFGLSEEEHQLCVEMPGGIEFFTYLTTMPEPLRVADFSSYSELVGLPEVGPPLGPLNSFLSAPIRHRGQHVGNLYLLDKRDGLEFTPEDEDTLLMFASHAAMAIANARRYRDEQMARVNLETLVDTSPVGVVVFDARTGTPLSLNRESRRIVDGLRNPNQSAEELLEIVTCRRADGREISLEEFPLSKVLSTVETVRAEQMVLQVPDGRSVKAVLNVSPIHSEERELESVVVTLQDMTAFEETERMRSEFLGVVSHELLTPLAAIKGSATSALGSAFPLSVSEVNQFFRIVNEQADHMRNLIKDLIDITHIESGTLEVVPEPVDLATLVEGAMTAFLSGQAEKSVEMDVAVDIPNVMADRQRIVQVLGILLSIVSHTSPDSSVIGISAEQDDVHVVISVSDQGGGQRREGISNVFRNYPRDNGGSETGIRGSGLEMAVCKGIVEAHGGRMWAEGEGPGLGARFFFTIPMVEGGTGDLAAGLGRSSSTFGFTPRDQERILAMDTDPQILWYIRNILLEAGFTPIVASDPEELNLLIDAEKPGLILLDIELQGADLPDMMKRIPQATDAPVVFLSGRGGDWDIERAFKMGGDDYIVKPFSPTELVARVRASLRRRAAGAADPSEPYVMGDLTINYEQRRAVLGGRSLQLTNTEWRLLSELSINAGRILTNDQLMRRVWSLSNSDDTQVVRAYVKRLRRKVGDDAKNPTYIFNEPGVGYRMPEPEKASF